MGQFISIYTLHIQYAKDEGGNIKMNLNPNTIYDRKISAGENGFDAIQYLFVCMILCDSKRKLPSSKSMLCTKMKPTEMIIDKMMHTIC